jgi:hypothetical protein
MLVKPFSLLLLCAVFVSGGICAEGWGPKGISPSNIRKRVDFEPIVGTRIPGFKIEKCEINYVPADLQRGVTRGRQALLIRLASGAKTVVIVQSPRIKSLTDTANINFLLSEGFFIVRKAGSMRSVHQVKRTSVGIITYAMDRSERAKLLKLILRS